MTRLKKEHSGKPESPLASADREYENESSPSEIFCLKPRKDVAMLKLRVFDNVQCFSTYQGFFIILVQ